MKKSLRAIFSIVLSVILVISAAVFPSAADAEAAAGKCGCGEEPIIYVAALGSATLYQNADTPEERVIFRPEASAYVKLVFKLLPAVFSLIATKDYDRFSDRLIPALDGVFGALANDEKGDSTPDVTTKTSMPEDPAHNLDTNYYFGYDFRADPFVTAEKFDEYIDHVMKLTGHDKVRLRASSMGGVVTMAYLEKFGTEKIKSIIFQCCPIQGTAVAGDLFNGNVEINSISVYRYAKTALPSLLDGLTLKFVMTLVDGLYRSGALDKVLAIVNRVADNCKDRVFAELLIPVFKSNCGIWSFVPDEYYESAKDFMLGGDRNEILENRLDDYHYNVQQRAGDILNGALDAGVPVMIVAGENIQRTPLVPAWENDSDGTVDTKYASVGATVAKLGETLGEGYVQAVADSHNHISPDKNIDASTCELPENTWIIKNMLHSKTHNGHKAMYKWFYENDGNGGVTVHSNPDYPQFLVNDVANKRLIRK